MDNEQLINDLMKSEDKNSGYMCVDKNRVCVSFAFTEINREDCETVKVTCINEIDIEKIQGYILNDDNSITWSQEQWDTYVYDVVEPNDIRCQREMGCYSVINRGEIWYSMYVNTSEREIEFKQWYQAWLDAPATRIIPTKPEWIN